MQHILSFLCFLFFSVTIFSQNPEWIIYNTSNSGLPSDKIHALAIDESGNKWIGTDGGLVKFDGINWTIYNSSNTNLSSNEVRTIAIDDSGNKWIGLIALVGGLAEFDNTEWTIFYNSSSGLPSDEVESIAIDHSGNKWIGTSEGGLAKFDDTNWTIYNSSNSGLPDNNVSALATDANGIMWIGTNGLKGLVKFDGTNWTLFNTSNSGLPHKDVFALAIANNGNKWIGTERGGVAVYNENGVVTNINNDISPIHFSLFQNYPNPFNPTTKIEYSIPKTSNVELKVFDLLGREIAELVNEEKPAGNYTVNFNASELASGIYYYRIQADNFIKNNKMILLK